ncbi:MAG TPA: hypothetical protein VLG47_06060 [Candidatus Saccharimonadales bacterium]|nr:hypothetical protein [Candidatus Saccharimonadales bacterium]
MEKDSSQSGTTKRRSTSWLWLAAAIVVLIVVGGSIAYFNHKTNKTTVSSSPASKKTYDLVSNVNLPMLITVNTRQQGDNIGNITTLQSDGKGNYTYTLFLDGKPINTTTYTPDALYVCKGTPTACVKYPPDTSSNDFQPTNYLYSTDIIKKINALKTTAYQGQKPCPIGGGTCDVWTYSVAQSKKTDYVNTATKRLVTVIDAGHFGKSSITSKITYQYQDEHINVPTNYTDAPAEPQASPDMSHR